MFKLKALYICPQELVGIVAAGYGSLAIFAHHLSLSDMHMHMSRVTTIGEQLHTLYMPQNQRVKTLGMAYLIESEGCGFLMSSNRAHNLLVAVAVQRSPETKIVHGQHH